MYLKLRTGSSDTSRTLERMRYEAEQARRAVALAQAEVVVTSYSRSYQWTPEELAEVLGALGIISDPKPAMGHSDPRRRGRGRTSLPEQA